MVTGPPPARSGRERDRVQQQIEVATMTTQSVGDTERRFAAHEHRDLALGLAYIAETVERSRAFSSTELWARLHHTLGWLENELRPHLAWEATWLYPEFDAIAGTPWATRLPRYEHRQIEAGIAALEVDSARWFGHSTPQTDADLVAHLSAIRALIAAHIEREDRFLLPLLEERGEVVG
jgi:iron-sulfur cluster repair protein YtfE (RIC family)